METMPMKTCQRRLALLWFVLGGISILITIIQLAGGHFGDSSTGYAERMFQWLLPAILPSLGLIVGALATPLPEDRQADGFFFWLTMAISGTYLLIILGLILTKLRVVDMMEMIDASVWWIGPLQGLVSGVMGYFFFREKPDE